MDEAAVAQQRKSELSNQQIDAKKKPSRPSRRFSRHAGREGEEEGYSLYAWKRFLGIICYIGFAAAD